MEKTYNVLCIGVLVMDIMAKPVPVTIFEDDTTITEHMITSLGGDAANEAVICSKLVGKTGLIAKVGDDMAGNQLIKILREEGVDTRNIRKTSDLDTSMSIVLINSVGERCFIAAKNRSNDFFCKDDFDIHIIKETRVLSYGGMYHMTRFDPDAPDIMKYAQDNGVITIADCIRDIHGLGDPYARRMLPHIDYFVPSFVEAKNILGTENLLEMTTRFRSYGCPNVIIKLGAQGVFIDSPAFQGIVPTFLDAPVKDTTGAGDNFVAGFICALLEGRKIEDAALFANAAASISIGEIGATAAVQNREQINHFLENHTTGCVYK